MKRILLSLMISVLTLCAQTNTSIYDATVVWELGGDPSAIGTYLYWGEVRTNQTPSNVQLGKVNLPGNGTNYVFTNLLIGATYWMNVVAYNQEGLESIPSNTIMVQRRNTFKNTQLTNIVILSLLGTNNWSTYQLAQSGTNGVVNGTPPVMSYKPNTNYLGKDSFLYVLTEPGYSDGVTTWVQVVTYDFPVVQGPSNLRKL